MTQQAELSKATSAGGVVYRRVNDHLEVVICGRKRERLWMLPKGTPEAGETLEATALREVQEETGLQVEIEARIGSIFYQFTASDGTVYDKRVEHHLMTPVGGSLERHDGEFDVVRWSPVAEAQRLLIYRNERDMLRRAVRLIEERRSR